MAVAVAVASTSSGAVRPSPPVSVYPIPGDLVAPPGSQIAFRGVSPKRLTNIVVRGTKSGLHRGRGGADSEGGLAGGGTGLVDGQYLLGVGVGHRHDPDR